MAGALLNPATAVAGPESSFGQNTQNPTSSASGDYGFLTSTWQQDLAAIGGNTTQYPTAVSAPNSVQTAVFAYEYNTRGFSAWTCPNCDPVFTQELANNGGPSAYAAPGSLSTNPTDYASLDTPGGLQAYFASNSGGSFVGAVAVGGGAQDGANAAPNASPTAKPYSYAYTMLITGSAQGISNNIQNVQQFINPWLFPALALSIMVVAIATMFGRASINSLFSHMIRVSLVVAFVAPGSAFYTNYVINPVAGLPAAMATAFGVRNAGPAAVFDDANITLWAITETILGLTHISWQGDGLGTVLVVGFLYVVGAIAIFLLFLPYLAVNYLLLLMLALGPIAIVTALFRVLDKWLMGFVDVVATLAVSMLAIDIVISLFEADIVQLFQGFVPSAVADSNVPAFLGLVGILGLMAFVVWKYLVPTIARMFSGVGLGLGDGALFLAGQASRAVRFATR